MKKYYFISGIALAVLLAASPVVTAETSVDVDATVEVDAELNPAAKLREKLRLQEEMRLKMLQQKDPNAERSLQLRNKMVASTTIDERKDARIDARGDIRDVRMDNKDLMRNASTSGERKEIRRDMRHDIFKIRHMHLVRQLGISLDNLEQVRERILSRIEKLKADGKSVIEIEAALAIADSKIVTAKAAVAALSTYVPPTPGAASTTANTEATVTVDLEKPREIGEVAIKAVKEARRALQDVVVAIAHAMGMGPRTPTATTTVDTGGQVTP